MARRKKQEEETGAAWLVTFSDLMTLLLTFFVLLLSMSSMDRTVLTRITSFTNSLSHISFSGAGKLPERVELITKVLRDPQNILNKKKRIKDLLFPHDALPKDISESDLEKNLSILEHPEGVVIVLTEGLLFSPGSAVLDEKGGKLLSLLTPVLHGLKTDVNVSGHSDAMERADISNDELSFYRALVVVEHFLHEQMPPDRFSVSGYGADKPMFSNETDEGRAKNRRVEILVKTTPRIGSYI